MLDGDSLCYEGGKGLEVAQNERFDIRTARMQRCSGVNTVNQKGGVERKR